MEVVVRIQRNALPFPLWSCYHEYSWKKTQIEKKILEVYLKQIQKRDSHFMYELFGELLYVTLFNKYDREWKMVQ